MRVGVLGAGPAAGAAALRLAAAGGEVTVFRPARPAEKPCGGGVPDFVLDEVEPFDSSSLPSVQPSRAALENAAGQVVRLDLGGLRIFRRRDLDPALLAAAQRSGARVVDSKVSRLSVRERAVIADTGDRTDSFDWLVAADGAHGLSRRSLGLEPGPMSLGAGASLEGIEADSLVLGFPNLGDAYLWIFPRPGGCSVGVAYTPSLISRGAAESALAGFLARHLGPAGRWDGPRYRYPIPLYSATTEGSVRFACQRRILLVGDAAGVADPLTREGIRPAMRSGRLAADCLLAGRPAAYPDRLEAALGREMRRARRAADLFFDDPIGQWMIPVSRLHAGVRRVLRDLLTCRQSYLGLRRRLLRAAVGADAATR